MAGMARLGLGVVLVSGLVGSAQAQVPGAGLAGGALAAERLDTPAARLALRKRLLSHPPPPVVAADRNKQEADLAFDMLRVEATVVFGAALPRVGQYRVELVAREDLFELPFFMAYGRIEDVRVDGLPAPFFEEPQLGAFAVQTPVVRGQTVVIEFGARLEFLCFDPVVCIDFPPLVHVVDPSWYPLNALDPLGDPFELAVAYVAPPSPVASSGRREGIERDGEGRETWRYRTERDGYLAAFAVGAFGRVAHGARVETFPVFASFDEGRALAAVSEEIIALYTVLFGFYPFSSLGVAPISDEAGVALGPQALILLPESFFLASPFNAEAWTVVRQVVAHEIGHQYFFNTVRVTGESEAWLSESFAEYVSVLHSESVDLDERHFLENYWGYVWGVPPELDAPVHSQAVRNSPAYFEVVYLKGSAALVQLRRRLGAPTFDDALRVYVERFTDRSATTADLMATLMGATGVDLSQYFAQWLDRPGFPTLTVRVEPARDERPGYAVTVRQESPLGPFADDLPVRLVYSDGGSSEAFWGLSGEYTGPESPQGVVIDPQLTVFRRVVADPPGDVNLSGVVDGIDLLDVTFAQGQRVGVPGFVETADVNGDGAVGPDDLAAVVANFGSGW